MNADEFQIFNEVCAERNEALKQVTDLVARAQSAENERDAIRLQLDEAGAREVELREALGDWLHFHDGGYTQRSAQALGEDWHHTSLVDGISGLQRKVTSAIRAALAQPPSPAARRIAALGEAAQALNQVHDDVEARLSDNGVPSWAPDGLSGATVKRLMTALVELEAANQEAGR